MLRTTPVRTISTRFTYTLPTGTGPAPGAGPVPQRYRASVYISINNLTNHANLSGFSGVRTSPFFMTATGVQKSAQGRHRDEHLVLEAVIARARRPADRDRFNRWQDQFFPAHAEIIEAQKVQA
jgi:hypothetical protein